MRQLPHAGRITRCLLLLCGCSAFARAESAWTRLIADDTVLVATAPLDVEVWQPVLTEVGRRFPPQRQPAIGIDGAVNNVLRRLGERGARDVAVLLRMSDWQSDRGFVIAVGFDREPPAAAAKLLQALADELNRMPNVAFPVQNLTLSEQRLVLLGSEASLDRSRELLKREQPSVRPALSAALEQAKGDAALVMALDDDSRRVIRELWATPAEPFAEATADLLADGLRSLVVSLSPEDLTLEVIANAEGEQQAASLLRLMKAGRDRAVFAMIQEAAQLDPSDKSMIVEFGSSVNSFLDFQQEANRAVARINGNDPRTRFMIDKLTSHWSELSARPQRMNQFKQIALAMHNYYDVNGHLPAAGAFRGENNEPLLSWRVALLPYLEQKRLYDRFRLDEPWDSPHNLSLLEQMPDVFADPSRPQLKAEGKTTYQTPIGPDTLFLPPGLTALVTEKGKPKTGLGFRFQEVADGLSNTLMVIEARSNRAVPWTKPADWEVDPAKPLDGLRTAGPLVSAWGDGHAEMLDAKRLNGEEFYKLLTAAGHESIDRDKLLQPTPTDQ